MYCFKFDFIIYNIMQFNWFDFDLIDWEHSNIKSKIKGKHADELNGGITEIIKTIQNKPQQNKYWLPSTTDSLEK